MKTKRLTEWLSLLLLLVLPVESGCERDSDREPAAKNDTGVSRTPTASKRSRHVFHPADQEPLAPHADLGEIRSTGELRFLFVLPEYVSIPREGGLFAQDMDRAEALVGKLGLKARFVGVASESELFGALREGRGDVVGTLFRPDDSLMGIVFSTSVKHVKEVLAGRRGAGGMPGNLDGLTEQKIHMPDLPESDVTIERIGKSLGHELKVEKVPGLIDSQDMLDAVGSGQYELTIVRSDHAEEFLTYRDDVELGFVLEERVPVAWAVREGSAELIDSINGFIYELAMTPHRRRQFGGDLDDVRERRVLRVAMLNNSVAYFIYRGQEVGFQFELVELLTQRLSVRLEIVVPELPKDVARMLVDNRADLAVISPTDDPVLTKSISYSIPFHSSDQVLVQPAGQAPITTLSQLMGKTIHVRRSSQYRRTLEMVSWAVPRLTIVDSPEELETEDLIDQVARRKIPLTVANSVLLNTELNYRDDVQGSLVLARNMPLVFAVRKESKDLLERVNRFVREDCASHFFEELNQKYFSGRKRMVEVRTGALDTSGTISPYDELVRKYGRKFSIDWRLLLAQMYQESRFDPKALSWAGAQGLLQVMPETGHGLGFTNLWEPETNIHAGVKYLSQLLQRFELSLPMRQRVRFALAAYNAGLGHVRDARKLAFRIGYDPNRWFGHVENAMRLLEKAEYHREARHGYCRGSEPVQYVSQIQTKYDAYVRLMPADGPGTSGP